VLREQAERAAELRPDLVLLAVGTNDATHLVHSRRLARELDQIVEQIRERSPEAGIVLTGAQAVDTTRVFPQPLRSIVGWRARRLNRTVQRTAERRGVVFAPVADQTAPLFRADPECYAPDGLHPSARGYAAWVPVLTRALEKALAERPPAVRA